MSLSRFEWDRQRAERRSQQLDRLHEKLPEPVTLLRLTHKEREAAREVILNMQATLAVEAREMKAKGHYERQPWDLNSAQMIDAIVRAINQVRLDQVHEGLDDFPARTNADRSQRGG